MFLFQTLLASGPLPSPDLLPILASRASLADLATRRGLAPGGADETFWLAGIATMIEHDQTIRKIIHPQLTFVVDGFAVHDGASTSFS